MLMNATRTTALMFCLLAGCTGVLLDPETREDEADDPTIYFYSPDAGTGGDADAGPTVPIETSSNLILQVGVATRAPVTRQGRPISTRWLTWTFSPAGVVHVDSSGALVADRVGETVATAHYGRASTDVQIVAAVTASGVRRFGDHELASVRGTGAGGFSASIRPDSGPPVAVGELVLGGGDTPLMGRVTSSRPWFFGNLVSVEPVELTSVFRDLDMDLTGLPIDSGALSAFAAPGLRTFSSGGTLSAVIPSGACTLQPGISADLATEITVRQNLSLFGRVRISWFRVREFELGVQGNVAVTFGGSASVTVPRSITLSCARTLADDVRLIAPHPLLKILRPTLSFGVGFDVSIDVPTREFSNTITLRGRKTFGARFRFGASLGGAIREFSQTNDASDEPLNVSFHAQECERFDGLGRCESEVLRTPFERFDPHGVGVTLFPHFSAELSVRPGGVRIPLVTAKVGAAIAGRLIGRPSLEAHASSSTTQGRFEAGIGVEVALGGAIAAGPLRVNLPSLRPPLAIVPLLSAGQVSLRVPGGRLIEEDDHWSGRIRVEPTVDGGLSDRIDPITSVDVCARGEGNYWSTCMNDIDAVDGGFEVPLDAFSDMGRRSGGTQNVEFVAIAHYFGMPVRSRVTHRAHTWCGGLLDETGCEAESACRYSEEDGCLPTR